MAKYAVYLDVDDEGKETGKYQVAEEEDEFVLEVVDTEEEAERRCKELQDESDRQDKMKAEYLEWEKGFMERHNCTDQDIRDYLANCVFQ